MPLLKRRPMVDGIRQHYRLFAFEWMNTVEPESSSLQSINWVSVIINNIGGIAFTVI